MSRKVAREAPALARGATSKTKQSRASSREPAAKPVGSGAADALLAYSQKRDFAKTAEPKSQSARRPATASACRSTTRRGSITT